MILFSLGAIAFTVASDSVVAVGFVSVLCLCVGFEISATFVCL